MKSLTILPSLIIHKRSTSYDKKKEILNFCLIGLNGANIVNSFSAKYIFNQSERSEMSKFLLIILSITACIQAFAQQSTGSINNSFDEYTKINDYQISFIKKFCNSNAKVDVRLIEEISRSLSVHPKSVSIERIGINWKDITFGNYERLGDRYDLSPECNVVLYSPRGSHSCLVHFNEIGIIDSACNLGEGNSFTRRLGARKTELFLMNRKKIESPPPTSTRRYDLGTGRALNPAY